MSDITYWSERQRLHFIERVLYWRGFINRRDLIGFYGISAPQATNDLVNYQSRNPGGCVYNVRRKRYEAGDSMQPVLIEPDFGADMAIIAPTLQQKEGVPFVLEPDQPVRLGPQKYLQRLCRAVQQQESLEVRYFSVKSGTADWRRISPRAFGHDGLRWHVRSYCHKNESFRDFNVGRMKGLRAPLPCPFSGIEDAAWTRHGTMVLAANPDLKTHARQALEMDYNMRRGKLRFPVREAMLTYTARRLGFIKPFQPVSLPMLNERKELLWVDWIAD